MKALEQAEGRGSNPYYAGNFDGERDELRDLRLTLVAERDALLRQAMEALLASTPKACSMDDDYAEQGWHRHSKTIEAIRNHLGVQNDL